MKRSGQGGKERRECVEAERQHDGGVGCNGERQHEGERRKEGCGVSKVSANEKFNFGNSHEGYIGSEEEGGRSALLTTSSDQRLLPSSLQD